MKLVYDRRFQESAYAEDNAAMPGRMEAAMAGLMAGPWAIVSPLPATSAQLRLAHDDRYIQQVTEDRVRFEMARLAAGGAILAARLAHGGEPAFACVRPRGITRLGGLPGAIAPSAMSPSPYKCCTPRTASRAPL